MSEWGWRSTRAQGIWRYGPAWMRPFAAAVPWVTVGLLLLLLRLLSDTLSISQGTAFELPEAGQADVEPTSLVALVMPGDDSQPLVFFDDARYALNETIASSALADHLTDRAGRVADKSLLVLVDRRVASGETMKLASLARKSGLRRILFAEKRSGGVTE